jgi:predicted Zn-dependent peptidase
MARTAVVVGTATAVRGRVSRRQQTRWAQEDQAAYAAQPQAAPPPQYARPAPQYAAPPPPPAAPADDVYAQLRKLAELKDAGILTEEEFTTKKAQLLGL